MSSIKHRLIQSIGLQVIERPRQLQLQAQEDEHNIVHVLYRLQKQGLVEFRKKRSLHSPGMNLTDIRLTDKGREVYRQLEKR